MKPFIVANWKANINLENIEHIEYDPDVMDVALASPLIYSDYVRRKTKKYVKHCAQDCSKFDTGSYTGEIPSTLLKKAGIEHVLIGHCERRQYFNEDNEVLALKVQKALECKLKVIYCIGETREDRERGNHLGVLYNQFFTVIGKGITIDVAYEPVWAIGTGVLPSPEEVQDVFVKIRKWADSINVSCRILYGGSVNISTIKEFESIQGLDGFLIGRLSLTDEFLLFIKEYEKHLRMEGDSEERTPMISQIETISGGLEVNKDNKTIEDIENVKCSIDQVDVGINNNKETISFYKNKTKVKKTLLCLICMLSSFTAGYTHSSYFWIMKQALQGSHTIFDGHKTFLSLIPPSFSGIGSLIGIIIMFSIKNYNHKTIIVISLIIGLISYGTTFACMNTIIVLITRFLLGFSGGISGVVMPQIFYSIARQERRSFITTLNNFSYLQGLTVAFGVGPYAGNYFMYLILWPIFVKIAIICFFLFSGPLAQVEKKYNFVEGIIWLFKAQAVKSVSLVVLLHLFTQSTGQTMISSFSNTLFEGGEYSNIKNMCPLELASIMNLITGIFPDLFGRKRMVILCLIGIWISTATLGYFGSNLFSYFGFIFSFNLGLNSVPGFYQNEICKLGFEPIMNEIGVLSNSIIGLLVAIFIAFYKPKLMNSIWFIFSVMSLIGVVVLSTFMIETKGIEMEKKDFVPRYNNIKDWKAKKINY